MIAFVLAAALAQEAPSDAARTWDVKPHALRHTQAGFLAGELLGAVVLGFAGPDVVYPHPPDVSELTCDPAADPRVRAWCNPPGFDEAVLGALVMPNRKAAGAVSHSLTMGVSPVLALSGVIVPAVLTKHASYGLQDSIIILDAFALSTGANSIAKIGGQRQRPGFYYGREELGEAATHPDEQFVSFYSGDTTWAFTLASSASTLAFLRGYPHARVLAVTAGTIALAGGVLRTSADMHWPTDVLTGAVIGTAIGVGLPLGLHGRAVGDTVALLPNGRGVRLVVAF